MQFSTYVKYKFKNEAKNYSFASIWVLKSTLFHIKLLGIYILYTHIHIYKLGIYIKLLGIWDTFYSLFYHISLASLCPTIDVVCCRRVLAPGELVVGGAKNDSSAQTLFWPWKNSLFTAECFCHHIGKHQLKKQHRLICHI